MIHVTGRVARPIAPAKTFNEAEARKKIIECLSFREDIDPPLLELANLMFPNEDLSRVVLQRRLEKRIDELTKGYDFYVDDVYEDDNDDGVFFTCVIDISPESFIENHARLQNMNTYLANKFKTQIRFLYRIEHYHEYHEQKEEVVKVEDVLFSPTPANNAFAVDLPD